MEKMTDQIQDLEEAIDYFDITNWVAHLDAGEKVEAKAKEACRIVCQAARAYLSAQKDGWRPIETAPMHQPIMVYNQMTGPYVSQMQGGGFPLGFWAGSLGKWYPQPTHWQPLPDAPTTGDK